MDSFFKNKKIAAYIALKHHTRFIVPVMEKLKSFGAEPVYIVGQAERSQEATAIEMGLRYFHVFDFVTPADQEDVNQTYVTIRDGIARGIKKDVALGAAALLTVLDKSLYSTAREYIGFKNFIKKEKPDLCFALHEVNRWGKMLAFWSKKANVPFFTLQEGLANVTDYLFIGHVQYSTLNLVWGNKTRKKLIDFEAPADRVLAVGNTHIAQEISDLKKKNTRAVKRTAYGIGTQFIVLLLFSGQPSDHQEVLPVFRYFAGSSNGRLFVKFHPSTPKVFLEKWFQAVPAEIKEKVTFIHGEESTYDLMAMSDLCVIAEPSTTGLEALALGKPLVQLKLSKPDQYPYDFVADRVALHLTPAELIAEIESGKNFPDCFDPRDVQTFIEEELTDTAGAADRIITIMEKAISYNTAPPLPPFSFHNDSPPGAAKWSIIIPVSDTPEHLLTVLESVSVNSEQAGAFEVILLKTEHLSTGVQDILSSLEGDVRQLVVPETANPAERMNTGASHARGKRLVFFDRDITPTRNWLKNLDRAFDTHGPGKIFGANIINRHGNLIHAGIVLDFNNAPVSAYKHLDPDFPPALKERPFQMVDYFLGMDRALFRRLGGFNPRAGRFAFMDLCLTAGNTETDPAVYIPGIRLMKLDPETPGKNVEDAVCFYSKWHGRLWESEEDLYKEDGVSALQLEAARMTRAMKIAEQ